MTNQRIPGIGNRRALEALTTEQREQRRLSLRVLSSMREDRALSLNEASKREGISPTTVRRYADTAMERRGNRWRAKSGDRLYRPMVVYSNGSVVDIDVRGSRKASEVSDYYRAVGVFLDTGDERALRRFEGKTVAGVPYETDPSVLEEMARRGQLDMDSIYQLVA